MKILIDIGHPAHVHLFRNFAREMHEKGNEILFTCRDKEFEIYLLEKFGFNYKSFGKKYSNLIGKLWGVLEFDVKEFFSGLKFKPDILISHGSIYAAHASFLLNKPHISLEDTFNFEQIRLYKPFTKIILTSDYDHPLKSEKVINYAGYHELAYLHPRIFTPDESVLSNLNVAGNEKYTIVRFVSWNASHDIGHKGISAENKKLAVFEFLKHGKVFISSEKELPEELKKFRIQIPPDKMLDAVAFSTLYFGESATMATESAVLGIPSIFISKTGRCYTKDLEEKYGLILNFSESEDDQILAIEKGVELLLSNDINKEWQKKRKIMLDDKIRVTDFLIWFIENYPESFNIMKENPKYQERFR